ncbi:CDP-diacylglycerol--glycerol-3-phosphate 3-phosphatidyltransferase [Sediminibacterium sp. TEGAF015]|nr:CDP-diacylglycerol--glycerol-3-phosphate 3-phosphatidyltransferase [Sediminibacterium sp. TEGAF015]
MLTLIPIYFIESSVFTILLTIWIGISDFLDGYIARKWNVTTVKGEKLDQYIDKLVLIFFLFFYVKKEQLSTLFILLILIREALILLLRGLNKISPTSNILGKTKTFLLYILFISLATTQYLSMSIPILKYTLEILILVTSYSSFILSIKQ